MPWPVWKILILHFCVFYLFFIRCVKALSLSTALVDYNKKFTFNPLTLEKAHIIKRIHWTHTHMCPAFCFTENDLPWGQCSDKTSYTTQGVQVQLIPFVVSPFLTHFTQLTSLWREDERSSEILQDVLMLESDAWNIKNVSFGATRHLWIKKTTTNEPFLHAKHLKAAPFLMIWMIIFLKEGTCRWS